MPPSRLSPLATSNTCPKCAKPVDAGMPFCGHCGTKVTNEVSTGSCWTLAGAAYTQGIDLFCARCGTRVGQRVSMEVNNAFGTLVIGAKNREVGPKLALLNESGEIASTFSLDRGEAVVGRGDADDTSFPRTSSSRRYTRRSSCATASCGSATWVRATARGPSSKRPQSSPTAMSSS